MPDASTTRRKIRYWRSLNPPVPVAEIAERLKISPQRVYAILKKDETPAEAQNPISVAAQRQTRLQAAILAVAADIYSQGWIVAWPFFPTPRFHLMAVSQDGKHRRLVEVRVGRRRGRSLLYSRKGAMGADHIAVFIASEPPVYLPDLP